jgi:CheY-like chemotaxis protein
MADQVRTQVRVLVVDDEPDVRDAYRQILLETEVSQDIAGFRELRARLFAKAAPDAAPGKSLSRGATFDPVFCEQAEAAVAAVQEALAQEQPFAVVFLDMRMPPGRESWLRFFGQGYKWIPCRART